jgi:hypothetical protein
MPSYHAMEMRFIRRLRDGRADPDSRHDDLMRILKVGENSVRVVYSERSADGVISDTIVLTYFQLIVYLQRIFWMLSIDEDPFQSVQFFLPGYPTILLQVSTLQQNVQRILEMVISSCVMWPTSTRPIEGLYHAAPPSAAAPVEAAAATGVEESSGDSDYTEESE